MKYQPTIFVDNDLYTKIQNGKVRIQCGQWIQLAWCDKPSRWVGLTSGRTMWAVHYPVRMDQFKTLCTNIDRFIQQPQQQDTDDAGCVHSHHERQYQSELAWERDYYGIDE